MSRKPLFFRSLGGGYLFALVNIFYSLATIPLAFVYLNSEEFGLWALVMQISGFLVLLDTGISSSIGRLLIDFKDKRPSQKFGSVFLSGLSILTLCGIIIVFTGVYLSNWLAGFFEIPNNLSSAAINLIILQALIAGISLPIRAVGNALIAYGRFDLLNLTFSISLIFGFFALSISLYLGAGVYSIIFANSINLVTTLIFSLYYAIKKKMLPLIKEFEWPNISQARELFDYGSGVFVIQIGNLILFSSQSLLLTKNAGLESAAAWAVGSKIFLMFSQVISKIPQSAGPLLSEMFVRSEKERLAKRINQIIMICFIMSLCCGVLVWSINSVFIEIWTHSNIIWQPRWDFLLMVYLPLRVLVETLSLHMGSSKQFHFYKYLPILESITFILIGYILIPMYGVGGLLSSAIIACILIQLPYLIFRYYLFLGTQPFFSKETKVLWFLPVPILAAAIINIYLSNFEMYSRLFYSFVILSIAFFPIVFYTLRKIPLKMIINKFKP